MKTYTLVAQPSHVLKASYWLDRLDQLRKNIERHLKKQRTIPEGFGLVRL